MAKRVLRGAAGQLSNAAGGRAYAAAETDEQLHAAAEAHGPHHPPLQQMADLVLSPAASAAARPVPHPLLQCIYWFRRLASLPWCRLRERPPIVSVWNSDACRSRLCPWPL